MLPRGKSHGQPYWPLEHLTSRQKTPEQSNQATYMAKTWWNLWDVRFWCLRTLTGAIVGLSFQATCVTEVEAATKVISLYHRSSATVAWRASQQWRSWGAQPLPKLEESMQTDLIHLHATTPQVDTGWGCLAWHVDTVARGLRCNRANLWESENAWIFLLQKRFPTKASNRKIWKSSQLDWS